MSYFTNKQIFYVNSADRLTGTDTDFSFYLNVDVTQEFDRVVVLSASIPKSYYLVQLGTNTFQLQENTSIVTITVTPGNYTRQSMATTIKNLLNANSPHSYTYNVSFNNINTTYDQGTYTFSVTGNGAVQPAFIFTTGLYEPLGFNKNSTYTFSGNSLVSPNVTNLSTETTLFIHSNICQNKEGNDILQEIYTSGDASFSYVNFLNPTPQEHSRVMGGNKSNIYSFSLTDENGNVISTNGVNINFTIMIYKENDIDSLIKGAIKYFTLMSEK
jgi:hypothetical protein